MVTLTHLLLTNDEKNNHFCKFFLLFFSNNLFANIKNNIVLKVENEIVTNYEIKNKIISTLVLSNQEINQKNIDSLKKQALEFFDSK